MFTVGVTGGIGSGKTTVCRVFGVLGIPVFSSDEAGRRLMAHDPLVRERIAGAFGTSVLAAAGVDRRALAAQVFKDPGALNRLNAIIHPAVRKAFAEWAALRSAPYVINEAAILVETGMHKKLDHLIVVAAPEEERIRRVMARDGASHEQVRARIRSQADDRTRNAAAGSIIVNDGRALVIPQVLAVHAKLLQLASA
ncbi:MAG: dephospho-CoA kinase [Bacteroidetes bacterium]|nr:dephospho-CoA kinase [Bacteroidota bacterium]